MKLPTIVVRGNVLLSWMTLSQCTRTQFAKDLKISTARISQLLNSTEEPSAHLMAKLLNHTHLPFTQLFKIIYSTSKPLASSKTPADHTNGTNGNNTTVNTDSPRALGRSHLVYSSTKGTE